MSNQSSNMKANTPLKLASVPCTKCNKSLVSIHSNNLSVRMPNPSNMETKDFLGYMQKKYRYFADQNAEIANGKAKGATTLIKGPRFNILYNPDHFRWIYVNNLSRMSNYTYCPVSIVLAEDRFSLLYRFVSSMRAVRLACMANDQSPEDLKDWMLAQNEDDLVDNISSLVEIQQISNTPFYGAIYDANNIKSKPVVANLARLFPEWAGIGDLSVSQDELRLATNYTSIISMDAGLVEYTGRMYNCLPRIKIPKSLDVNKLPSSANPWEKIVLVESPSGRKMFLALPLSGSGMMSGSQDDMLNHLDNMGVPERFTTIDSNRLPDPQPPERPPREFVL